jgi:hypothetical protein
MIILFKFKISENQEKKSDEKDINEKPICKHCIKPYAPNGLEECHECHELYCEICKKISLLVVRTIQNILLNVKNAKKLYHFDEY